MVKQYIQDLRSEFSGYNSSKFTADLIAGITVAAVALPLSLAFGVASGADAAAGLITAIFGGIIIGIFSGGSYQISGPTGSMSVILLAVVAQYGADGLFLVTFLAGFLRVLAGLLKLGRIVSIIPMPVVTGFTSGIAVIIALGQVDNFFGTQSEGVSAVAKLSSYWELGFSPDMSSVFIAVFVVLMMILWPAKWQKVFPSSLASIVLVTAVNMMVLHWDVAMVGEIPRTLLPAQRLTLSGIDVTTIPALMIPSMSIAALGMIESLLCGASAGRMKNEPLNADRELVAQGIGNMIIPFFGGVPATAAIARTSVAIKSGQQTRVTSVVHSLGLLLSMFLLSPIMSQIPMPALAGVLMMTAWRMNDWTSINYLFGRQMRAATVGFLLTMCATVIFDLSVAILAGLSFSAIMFTVKVSSSAEITVSEVDAERLGQRNMDFHASYERVKVIYVTGALFFGSVNSVLSRLEEAQEHSDVLVLSLRGLSAVDSTGVHTLFEFCQKAKQNGIEIYYTGVQRQVKIALDQGGVSEFVGEENFLWSTEDALKLVSAGK